MIKIHNTPFIFIFLFLNIYLTVAQPTCFPGVSKAEISEGNVRATFMNQGDMFWDPAQSVSKFKWPKNAPTNTNLVFAAAIWFGGIDKADNNNVIVSGQTYRASGGFRTYWPGPVTNGIATPAKECRFWDQHFKVTKQDLDQFFTLSLPTSPGLVPAGILRWPGKGNEILKSIALDSAYQNLSVFDQVLAPFIDVDGNGIYNPLIGDYPDLKNRLSMIWWVTNDNANNKSFPENTTLVPAGNLEFQMMASTYPVANGQNYLDNTIFIDAKVINKGTKTLDSCYIGFWTDFDIGNANDDFVECNVQENLIIGLNADNDDEGPGGYGVNPPAIAFKAIDGPMAYPADGLDNNRNGFVDEPGEKIFMSCFKYYNIGTNPINGEPLRFNHYYNLLKGNLKNGSKTTYGGNGTSPVSSTNPATTFMFPGASDPLGYAMGGTPQNPIVKEPWTELSSSNIPGDRRSLMSAGPFQLLPGASFHYTLCNLIAFGGTILENVNELSLISDSLDNYLPTITASDPLIKPKISNFDIFPNPAKDKITVSSTLLIEKIRIMDLQGRFLVESTPLKNDATIDLARFNSGLYLISIKAGGKTEITKMIKE